MSGDSRPHSTFTRVITTHGACSNSWEIQVTRKNRVWAVPYVRQLRRTLSYLVHSLDKQMKYISHMTFYQETTLSLNSSQLKERIAPWATSFISTQSLKEGSVFLVSIGLVRKLASMQWRLITLAGLLRTSSFAAIFSSRSRLFCSWLGS